MSGRSFRVGRSLTGLGLFATQPIKKGSFIMRYRGPKITAAESEKREARGNRYLYEINSKWVVDGSPRYNVARYANHSCRPNAESDTKGHKILVKAIKNIEPGDEITYHYGKNYFDIYLRPIGCKCVKCIEKRKKERAEKRAATKRKKAREARKAEVARTGGAPSSRKASKTSARAASSRTKVTARSKTTARPAAKARAKSKSSAKSKRGRA